MLRGDLNFCEGLEELCGGEIEHLVLCIQGKLIFVLGALKGQCAGVCCL